MWSVADIADALETGINKENERLKSEQAVYGLDAKDELQLHPLIEKAFDCAGYGVFREKRYPADRNIRRESEGERCDFVLTQDKLPLKEPDRENTLFDSSNTTPLSHAFWLEVKAAWQFTIEGPNPRYAPQMLSVSSKDVAKLSKDDDVLHAGLVLIAFVQDIDVAKHDLKVWYERLITKGMPVGYPSQRLVAITNRMGNGICAIAVCPVNHH